MTRCALQVVGRVLEVEDLVQTEATRKRMKHLAHLPLSGSHFQPPAGRTEGQFDWHL